MKLTRLYKTASSGATQVIDMEIIGDTYTRTWGQLDGKMQTKATTAKGKNIGKANETTPEAQAIIEAEAVWVKKQKANYSTSIEAPVTVKLPMKVNVYQKHMKKLVFPVYTSVKLNGVNSEYRMVDRELKLLSRGGEEYPIPKHQEVQVRILMDHLGTTSLNGEMYHHGSFLQEIMAATKKHNDLTPSLQFCIFDFPEVEGTYQERCSSMYAKDAMPDVYTPALPFVHVGMANSHEDLDAQHAEAVAAGYEGIMIRNADGLYEYNTRSLDVFKYKVAEDAEFVVTGFNIDKNGHAVFICDANYCNGTIPSDEDAPREFKVKLKGTNEERLAMAAVADTYIGKFLKVEFEMLSLDGIPQKPVGIMFRKVDEHGEAAE